MSSLFISPRRAIAGGVLVLLVTGLGRMAAMGGLAAALGIDVESPDPAARQDGLLLGVGLLGGCALGGLALFGVARPALRSTLALEPPSLLETAGWTAAALALFVAFRLGGVALGVPLVEAEWLDAYRTAPVALLGLGLVAASVFEELYFRGLLQGALARTRVGLPGAVAIPAALFVAAHLPDSPWRFFEVLCSALLFALIRHRSRSSLAAMPGHVLGNLAVLALLARESG